MRWVWDANSNDPVHENSILTFGEDGNLVLGDVDGRVAWQTNTANKGVTGIKLLPNGNLVLFDKNGKFIWKSFDYPTDTLLVGQSVKINSQNKFVSRTSDMDGFDGPYSMILDRKGFIMYRNNSGQLLIYEGWPIRNFADIVTFNVVLENDNATAYGLVLRTTHVQAQQGTSPGHVRGLPSAKGLLGWSESCKPPKLAPCSKGAMVGYYKVVGVEHFLKPYLDDGKGPMKVEQCRDKCTNDCKCLGFIYKEDTSRCLTAPVLGTLIKDANATSIGYIKYTK
ncbi:hypothetical protein PTKIN_Ptkin19aG0015700 [Pterospermum kingtungense]